MTERITNVEFSSTAIKKQFITAADDATMRKRVLLVAIQPIQYSIFLKVKSVFLIEVNLVSMFILLNK